MSEDNATPAPNPKEALIFAATELSKFANHLLTQVKNYVEDGKPLKTAFNAKKEGKKRKAKGDEDGDKPKKKRAQSGYNIFIKEQVDHLKGRADLAPKDRLTAAAAAWKELDEHDRKNYTEKAHALAAELGVTASGLPAPSGIQPSAVGGKSPAGGIEVTKPTKGAAKPAVKEKEKAAASPAPPAAKEKEKEKKHKEHKEHKDKEKRPPPKTEQKEHKDKKEKKEKKEKKQQSSD